MAIGTTQDFNLKRNEIIISALRNIRAVTGDEEPSVTQTDYGARLLNMILREEDLRGTGANVNLWAMTTGYLILAANQYVYDTSSSGNLSTTILELKSASYRDANGNDSPIKIISLEEYDAIIDKHLRILPERVWLEKALNLSDQRLWIDQALGVISTTSEVIGSDTLNYKCVLKHTSDTVNKPITGGSWRFYWTQTGSSGSAWVTATAYTSGELIRYSYKRPLFDFDLPTNNPDAPAGWGRYLTLRLSHDLSPAYSLSLEERKWLREEYLLARQEIFPSTGAKKPEPEQAQPKPMEKASQ